MQRAQDNSPPPTYAPPFAAAMTESEISLSGSLPSSPSSSDSSTTSAGAQDDKATPPQKFQRVPRVVCDAIDAAIREIERRARQGVSEEDAHLGHYPRVTIASNITQEMLDQIPDEWLEDRGVELLPSRVLVDAYTSSACDNFVNVEVRRQVAHYANANNLQIGRFSMGLFGIRQDLPVIELATRPSVDRAASIFAAFFVDVDKRSGPQILVAVAKWLTCHPSVQCVIYLKFFSHASAPNESSIPAIGLVFRRGDGCVQVADPKTHDDVTLCRVVVAETRSFGNASIPPSALDAFLAEGVTPTAAPHVLLQNPFDSVSIGLLQASCLFSDRVNRAAISSNPDRVLENARGTERVRAELARLRAEATRLQEVAARDQTEAVRERAEMAHVVEWDEDDEVSSDDVAFSVAMVAQLPAIRLDLILVHWNALQGLAMDFPIC